MSRRLLVRLSEPDTSGKLSLRLRMRSGCETGWSGLPVALRVRMPADGRYSRRSGGHAGALRLSSQHHCLMLQPILAKVIAASARPLHPGNGGLMFNRRSAHEIPDTPRPAGQDGPTRRAHAGAERSQPDFRCETVGAGRGGGAEGTREGS